MAQETTWPAPMNFLLPGAVGLLAIGIFAFDTLSTLGMAAAVLYCVVVLLSAIFLQWRGILAVSIACMALAISSYFLAHGEAFSSESFARLIVSLLAIGITAFLAVKRQSADAVVYEQARLLDLTHDTIFVRDMKDVITYWNRGAEELYGWTAAEAIGKVSHQIMHTGFPAPLEAINADLLNKDRWEGELVHTRRDGQRLVVASRWSLQRDHRARPASILETNNDITDRKHAEEALRNTQMELAHVTRVTTLGELAASIAHEVNQPLAAIVTNGEISLRLLDREVPDLPEVREALEAMISSGRRASEIISRLRALVQRTDTQKVAVDLNVIVGEVIPLVQQEILRYQVSLRLELASTLPPVLGDRVQLQQVMINLVVNAIEAMVPVTDRPRELVIGSQSDDTGQVHIEVQDSGVGIEPDKADMLFNAFFTTKSKGMGMGLSICRSIIDNHGGSLQVSRNAGAGATFQLALPSQQEARS